MWRARWVVLLGLAAGCNELPTGVEGEFPPVGAPGDDGTGEPVEENPVTTADLYCEVDAVLEVACRGCHAPPTSTPPMLVSYEDMLAEFNGVNVAELSVQTMLGNGPMMPPSGAIDGADIAVLSQWLASGMPGGECDGFVPSTGEDPYNSAPVCSSGVTWTQGTEGSKAMLPGQACIACHETKGPTYTLAGTVYPTAHEPDNCYGSVGPLDGAFVEVVDANAETTQVSIRDGGNFYTDAPLQFPVQVAVVTANGVNPMAGPVEAADGDCNTCHTQDGIDGAPGRVVLPPL
jgi:cytochrome c551/c552